MRDEMTLPWPRTKENVGRKLARYYASTEYWDAAMGRVIQALRDAGQFENTIFVIAGDNGLSLGEHGLLGKQKPLRIRRYECAAHRGREGSSARRDACDSLSHGCFSHALRIRRHVHPRAGRGG
ncbi:MAG: sulfatase-like hydrolase/transferase [Chthoniobacter sp.]